MASTVALPAGFTVAMQANLSALCTAQGFTPVGWGLVGVPGSAFANVQFTQTLTAGQLTALNNFILAAQCGIGVLSVADAATFASAVNTCLAFKGIASPTLAQNNAATVAVIQVVRALIVNSAGGPL